MKIKLDENVPQRIVAVLGEWGHDVETCLSESLGGQPDDIVVDHLRGERRVLVTLDRGFSNIRQYPPGDLAGIVVVRLPNQLPSMIEAALRGLLYRRSLEDLTGALSSSSLAASAYDDLTSRCEQTLLPEPRGAGTGDADAAGRATGLSSWLYRLPGLAFTRLVGTWNQGLHASDKMAEWRAARGRDGLECHS